MLLKSIRPWARELAKMLKTDIKVEFSNGLTLFATPYKSYLHNCSGRGIYARGTDEILVEVFQIWYKNDGGSYVRTDRFNPPA